MSMGKRSHEGMALIAVLWLVAAMSLIMTGIVKTVRAELRDVGLQRQLTQASARGDAAILLALQMVLDQPKLLTPTWMAPLTVEFDGQPLDVHMQSLNGRVDLNRAPLGLLTDLYRYTGDMSADAAAALAQSTVETRQAKNSKGSEIGFDAAEDLLRVPGVSYDLYVKLLPLVTADLKNGSGRVNPHTAPYGVLLFLAAGDVQRANALFNQRQTKLDALDTTFIKPELIDMSFSRSLVLQAHCPLADGSMLLREWVVVLETDPRSGLPWRVLRTNQALGAAPQ